MIIVLAHSSYETTLSKTYLDYRLSRYLQHGSYGGYYPKIKNFITGLTDERETMRFILYDTESDQQSDILKMKDFL